MAVVVVVVVVVVAAGAGFIPVCVAGDVRVGVGGIRRRGRGVVGGGIDGVWAAVDAADCVDGLVLLVGTEKGAGGERGTCLWISSCSCPRCQPRLSARIRRGGWGCRRRAGGEWLAVGFGFGSGWWRWLFGCRLVGGRFVVGFGRRTAVLFVTTLWLLVLSGTGGGGGDDDDGMRAGRESLYEMSQAETLDTDWRGDG